MKHTSTIIPTQSLLISPQKILRWLALIVMVLLVANITGILLESVFQVDSRATRLIVRYFDFNGEGNIPAFFSSIILLIAGILLLLIHARQTHWSGSYNTKHWLILGVIFMFMAVDENVQLHEHVANYVRPMLGNDLSGMLHWAWVVPYGILTLLVVAYFLGFVLRLPPKTRNLIIISGAIFVTGALGLEFVEGYLYKRYGLDHLYNRIMYCLEELMEMTGVTLFIYALLDFLAQHRTEFVITAEDRNA
ncbi:multidrug transporter [uncultured Pontibacter sp.]|uniref:multidrug transporter n=1 Tax=uncultured Pontibacter sp. TaxID=453356 RepID=UPI0026252C6D|nr:multidrug transporter [uncultured Pontibacter sp.]